MDDINVVDKYGAIVVLKSIIDSLEISKNKSEIFIPGHDYLMNKLANLQNEIQTEIHMEFAGAINNLAEQIDGVKYDGEKEKL